MAAGNTSIISFSALDSFLSNTLKRKIRVDGTCYPSVEHYYQSSRFTSDPPVASAVARSRCGKSARQLAARHARLTRHDWIEVEELVMLKGLQAKFSQHADLRQKLLATGNALLLFDGRDDFQWGCGYDMSGANRLGELLMAVRQECAQEAATRGAARMAARKQRRPQRMEADCQAWGGKRQCGPQRGGLVRGDSACQDEQCGME